MMTQVRFMYGNEGVNHFSSTDHLVEPSYWKQVNASELLTEVNANGTDMEKPRIARFDANQPGQKNVFNITIIPFSVGGKKFRRRPLEVTALQIHDINSPEEFEKAKLFASDYVSGMPIQVKTLNGIVPLNPDEWIVKGVHGEFYPCDPKVFEKLHEAI